MKSLVRKMVKISFNVFICSALWNMGKKDNIETAINNALSWPLWVAKGVKILYNGISEKFEKNKKEKK